MADTNTNLEAKALKNLKSQHPKTHDIDSQIYHTLIECSLMSYDYEEILESTELIFAYLQRKSPKKKQISSNIDSSY